MKTRLCIAAVIACSLSLIGCGAKGALCAANTTEVAGECIADVTCGPGTTAVAGECIADVSCEPDAVEVEGACAIKRKSIEANNLAVAAANDGRDALAIEHFEEATRIYPANHAAWYGLGQMQGKQRNWYKAVESFEHAVTYDSGNAMYRLWLGIAQYENGDVDGAKLNLDKALELEPMLYRAAWYLGRVHRDKDRPREAAEAWTMACRLNPLYGPPFVRLGELYLMWDKVDEAIRVLEQGSQYVKEAIDLTNLYYYLGLAYDEKKQWDKSVAAYTEAIQQRRQNTDALFRRGLAYAKNGDSANAKADLEAYLQLGYNTFNKTQANKVLQALQGGN